MFNRITLYVNVIVPCVRTLNLPPVISFSPISPLPLRSFVLDTSVETWCCSVPRSLFFCVSLPTASFCLSFSHLSYALFFIVVLLCCVVAPSSLSLSTGQSTRQENKPALFLSLQQVSHCQVAKLAAHQPSANEQTSYCTPPRLGGGLLASLYRNLTCQLFRSERGWSFCTQLLSGFTLAARLVRQWGGHFSHFRFLAGAR